jgi:hypothetical protein
MRAIFSTIILLVCIYELRAQEVVFERDPAIDSIIPKWGANRKHFFHSYMGVGMAADPGEKGAKISQPHFFDEFRFGLRYKRRLTELLATGADLNYNWLNYKIRQNGEKVLPDTIRYQVQRMIFNQARLGAYIRINYGRRGNSLGNYFDLAAYGDFVISHILFTKFKNPDQSITRSRTNRLDYFNRLGYGAQFRAGFNNWVIYAQYRLSDIFYPSKNLPELPRITAGIEWNLRK